MNNILAVIVLFVLVFTGPINCGIKWILGIEPKRSLPKKFASELERTDK